MYNYLKLKNLAASKGVSNIEIAGIIGKSRITVGNFMRGKSSPTIEDLEKLAKYFDVPVTYFFEELAGSKSVKKIESQDSNEVVKLQAALIESLQREVKMLREFYDKFSSKEG